MDIVQVNPRQQAPPIKNWRILLVQSLTSYMPLLMVPNIQWLFQASLGVPPEPYNSAYKLVNEER